MELEWLAVTMAPDCAYPFDLLTTHEGDGEPILEIDTRPLIRAVVEDVTRSTEPARIARRFHSTMVEIIAQVCDRLRRATGLQAVVLSGGVFLNALLTSEVCARLTHEGFRVYRHRLVPPNDGGLSLGQLAIAAATLSSETILDKEHDPSKGAGHVSGHSGEGDRDLSRA
jgi:hydrogenase maturation protein HypF